MPRSEAYRLALDRVRANDQALLAQLKLAQVQVWLEREAVKAPGEPIDFISLRSILAGT